VDKKIDIRDLELISKWLDTKFQGPFGIKFGFDGLIGLIPGFGDLITTGLGSYILIRATNFNTPKIVIVRMAFNIVVDQLLGMIPILGDIFDFVWKSNEMNYKLVTKYVNNDKTVVATSWFNMIFLSLIGIVIFILPIFLIVRVIQILITY
jgi:hypothetical protein